MTKTLKTENLSPFFWQSCIFISMIMMKVCHMLWEQVNTLTSQPMTISLIFWLINVSKSTSRIAKIRTLFLKNKINTKISSTSVSITVSIKENTNYHWESRSKFKIYNSLKDSMKLWNSIKWFNSFYPIFSTLISHSDPKFWIWSLKECHKNSYLQINILMSFIYFKLKGIMNLSLKLSMTVPKDLNSKLLIP